MATILNGITGGFSGKVGNVIGGSWKGIDYMRSRATSISNPRTPAQVEQRARFTAVGMFLRPLTAFLRIGFKNEAVKMSGYNAAMAYTLDNAITGIYPAFTIDYSKVMVSQGNLPGALNPLSVSGTAGQVEFTWENNTWETNAIESDKSVLVVYNPSKQKAISVVDGISRSVGSQTITLPNSFTGDEVQCYIAFMDAKKTVISNSEYIGSLIVT